MTPWFADAIVTAQDGDNYRLQVGLVGGLGMQVPAITVSVATHGFRDGVRGDFPPLPAVGTHGRVSFTRGDMRNGRWEGAHDPALIDSATHTAGNPNVRYRAEFSGYWDWHGADGTSAQVWPDGTSLLLGSAMPVPTRHTLGPQQVRMTTTFTAAQRNPHPPATFPLAFTHGSGVKVTISAAGAVTVSGVAGQPVMLEDGSGGVVRLDGGTVSLTDASGGSVTQSGGTTAVSGVLRVSGDIFWETGGTATSAFTHTHSGVQSGGGTSGPPVPGS